MSKLQIGCHLLNYYWFNYNFENFTFSFIWGSDEREIKTRKQLNIVISQKCYHVVVFRILTCKTEGSSSGFDSLLPNSFVEKWQEKLLFGSLESKIFQYLLRLSILNFDLW